MSEVTLADLGFEDGKRVQAPAVPVGNGKLNTGATTSTEERALHLLGAGIAVEATAAALGVSPSRISQLLAEEQFADKVSDLRYQNLQKHNNRDAKYDAVEDTLLEKLESSLPLMIKPQDILRAVSTINSAKRRGQSSPDQVVNQQNIVNLILPQVITERFTVNIDNQVTRAGEQELHTMPASNLLSKVEREQERKQERLSHLEAPLSEEGLTVEAL